MMTTKETWRVVFYEAADGGCPVEEFLGSLDRKGKTKILARIDLLEEEGPNLYRPYADLLRDGIHELRAHVSKSHYRVLYFFCGRYDIVLTHGFQKKTQAVPDTEIKRASRYRDDWVEKQYEDS